MYLGEPSKYIIHGQNKRAHFHGKYKNGLINSVSSHGAVHSTLNKYFYFITKKIKLLFTHDLNTNTKQCFFIICLLFL